MFSLVPSQSPRSPGAWLFCRKALTVDSMSVPVKSLSSFSSVKCSLLLPTLPERRALGMWKLPRRGRACVPEASEACVPPQTGCCRVPLSPGSLQPEVPLTTCRPYVAQIWFICVGAQW